jgi:hypothetical protein
MNNKLIWSGRIVSAIAVLFLLFDAVIKLMKITPVVESFRSLGWDPKIAVAIGTVELVCVAVYLFPRTAILGAILMTGYLGGAIATHLRLGHPLLTHTLFPIYVAALLWGGLFLRSARSRALVLSPAH